MFEQLKQLFWSYFGAPREPEPVQNSSVHEAIVISDNEDGVLVVPAPCYGNPELQMLSSLYGGKLVEQMHRLLQPLFLGEDLGGKSWLSDDCIGNFLRALVHEYEQKNLNVEFISSQKTISSTNAFIIDRFRKGEYQEEKARLSQANLIFCPVKLKDNHWGLWVLDKRDEDSHKIYCLDGFNSNPFVSSPEGYAQSQNMYFDAYIKPLAELFDFDISKKYFQFIPRQGNGIDCGAVVCYWAKQICDNKLSLTSPIDVDFDPKKYTNYRMDIAKNILKCPAEEPEKNSKKRKALKEPEVSSLEPERVCKKQKIQ